MNIALGFARLLMAVAVFPLAFQFTESLGRHGVAIAFLVAVPLSGILMIARAHHMQLIVRSIVSCCLGLFGGVFLCPQVQAGFAHSDELRFVIAGAIVGWVAGHFLVRQDAANEAALEM